MSAKNLDPDDWASVRALGHRMLDDMIDYVSSVAQRPVWKPMSNADREALATPLPRQPAPLDTVYARFQQQILPFVLGNLHPRFMGWVHGGGNIAGTFAEFLAASINANLGGRDHAPIEVERQTIKWLAEIVGFPNTAGGIFATGSSLANFIAVLVARTAALGKDVRRTGLAGAGLTAYTSRAAHACISRAMEMAGLGSDALRLIPCQVDHRIDAEALSREISKDRSKGLRPFLVVGNAGTVDVGAIDDLTALADICAAENLWFHVDGAIGALANLSARLRPRLAGLDRANSIALDLHKWAQVPYDAGCILVKDRDKELDTFSQAANYLRRHARGLSAGEPWPSDLGPDLSRGFRALKVWFTFMTYGAERLGQIVDNSCDLARALAERIAGEPELELVGPVPLNIVCFRYVAGRGDLNQLNAEIAADIQESGTAAPSTTVIDGKAVIRAALFNHRTEREDVERLVDAVLRFGRQRAG